MPDILKIDVVAWVERAKSDPIAYRQRQATEITLNAIATTAPFNAKLYLKGGILMGLAYDSPRQTTDIDLTAGFAPNAQIGEEFKKALDAAFPNTAARLGYTDLVLITHTVKTAPRDLFPDAKFPALKLKIGFAKRGGEEEKGLLDGKPTGTVEVDISFNEPVEAIDILELTEGAQLHAYGLSELMAEKYRAMLQQIGRRRNRRQDVYDIHLLLEKVDFSADAKVDLLDSIRTKCNARNIHPQRDSLDNAEIKHRSGAEWQTMKLELGNLPDFDECFEAVAEFYRTLPW